MPTPHNEAKIGEIAKTVIMPGDPLRAKYIADYFLEDAKLVNKIRGMLAYTGKYKGKEISVMAHGMGIPSVGIYTYELFKYYDVENIIRIGSCGAISSELKLFDIVLSEKVFSESNYALSLNNDNCHICESSRDINAKIEQTAKEENIELVKGETLTSDCFSPYMTNEVETLKRLPEGFKPLSVEMEAFALFYNAKLLNKKAACIMSVVDSPFIKEIATTEEREKGLNNMIKLALEAGTKV